MLFSARAHVHPEGLRGKSHGGVAACESSVGGGGSVGGSGVAHEMIGVGRDAASDSEHDVGGGVGIVASTAASGRCVEVSEGGSGSGGVGNGVDGGGSSCCGAGGNISEGRGGSSSVHASDSTVGGLVGSSGSKNKRPRERRLPGAAPPSVKKHDKYAAKSKRG